MLSAHEILCAEITIRQLCKLLPNLQEQRVEMWVACCLTEFLTGRQGLGCIAFSSLWWAVQAKPYPAGGGDHSRQFSLAVLIVEGPTALYLAIVD